jgi:hypothetical protein
MSPSDIRKKEDHLLVISSIYKNNYEEYSDSLNPFEVGTLRHERFKRKYIRELPKAIDTRFRFKDLCEVYGTVLEENK